MKLLLGALAFVTVVACNGGGGDTAPSLNALDNLATTLGELVEVALTITDEEPSTVAVTATSSNEAVVAADAFSVSGSGAARQLTVTPTSETLGTTTITISAKDAGGKAGTESFELEVTAPFEAEPVTLTNEDELPMGTSVAISGKYAAVGAFESVYVFELVNDEWVEMQRLSPQFMNGIGINFGGSVDIDGERIIVGADQDYEGGDNAGAAYIFELVNGTRALQPKLVDPLPADFDSFGRSVAIQGDYAFVGAQSDVQDGVQSGSVFVFQRDPQSGWGLWGKLNPETPSDDHIFGEAVDADGDLLIVGDYGDPVRGAEAGSATVFHLDKFVWEPDEVLMPLELEANDQFGLSVAVDDGYVLVGARNDDDAAAFAGAVYVFHDTGTGWQQVDKLTANDAAANDAFGSSVVLDMPYAVIGANGVGDALNNQGAVYVFRFDGTAWHQLAKLASPTPAANAEFGWDVGLAGDHLIASQFGTPQLTAIFER